MLYDPEARREIFIIFHDSEIYFGGRLFKPGFTHCFAIERQALGWICIDPSRTDCLSHILPASFTDDVIGNFVRLNPLATVMQVFVSRHQDERLTYPRLGLISCVGIIQYNLGVYWPLIITPWQLYCRLATNSVEHIRVGNIWAEAEERNQSRRRKNLKRKPQDTEHKQKHYRNKPLPHK